MCVNHWVLSHNYWCKLFHGLIRSVSCRGSPKVDDGRGRPCMSLKTLCRNSNPPWTLCCCSDRTSAARNERSFNLLNKVLRTSPAEDDVVLSNNIEMSVQSNTPEDFTGFPARSLFSLKDSGKCSRFGFLQAPVTLRNQFFSVCSHTIQMQSVT